MKSEWHPCTTRRPEVWVFNLISTLDPKERFDLLHLGQIESSCANSGTIVDEMVKIPINAKLTALRIYQAQEEPLSMTSTVTKQKKLNGSVVIIAERCKGCGFCVEFCPQDCLELSSQYNAKGYHPPALTDHELCSGCDICGMMCPDFAIYGFMNKKR